MSDEPDPQLEQWLARKLRELPDQAAPPSLATNVLATLRARQALPWWRRSWFEWPAKMRWSAAAAVPLVVGLIALLGWQLWPDLQARYTALVEGRAALGQTVSTWLELGSAGARDYLSALPSYVWTIGLGLVVASYLMCVGLGTVFARHFLVPQESNRP